LILHGLFVLFAVYRQLATYALPAQRETRIPFQVRRVEINPATLKGGFDQPPSTTRPATDPDPAPQFSFDGRVIEQALKANPRPWPLPNFPRCPSGNLP